MLIGRFCYIHTEPGFRHLNISINQILQFNHLIVPTSCYPHNSVVRIKYNLFLWGIQPTVCFSEGAPIDRLPIAPSD